MPLSPILSASCIHMAMVPAVIGLTGSTEIQSPNALPIQYYHTQSWILRGLAHALQGTGIHVKLSCAVSV